MRPFILAICCILQIFGDLWGQSYSSVHYDTKSGLPSNTVYDISQDKYGFIWFATENGLSRFDGKNFRTFTTKDGLPDNSILKVHGDNSGRVYFTPFTHYLHYYENDSFFKVAIPEKYKLKLANVVYFANRGNKLILCGDNEGFILEDNKLLSVHDMYNSIPEESQLRATDSFLIAYNRDSLFFIYDSGEIKRYSRYEKDPPWTVLENGPDTPDKLPRGSRWKPALNLSIYVPDSLVYHRQGNVVGIFSIHSGDLKYRLKIDKLSGTYVDNENNLWLTTVGNGVYRLPSLEFRNISFGNQHEIFSLLQIDRHVLAGTDYSKLFSIPVANPQSTYHTTDFTRFLALSHNPVSKLTGRNRIYILQSDGHDLYIGTDAFFRKNASVPI